MFASLCHRRLLLHIRKIPGGGGTNPLQSIPGAIHLAHSYSSSAVADVTNSEPCPDTVSYLISCGLSPTAAAAATTGQRLRICSTEKAEAVCALLRDYGFANADIVRTLRSATSILTVDPERILRPKLDFLASIGLEPRKIASAPFLLVRSLDKHLVPSMQFLRGIIGSDDDLRLGFSRVPRALMADVDKNMRPAVEALRRCGLTEAAISKLVVINMGMLMASPDRIREVFEELKAIGMRIPDSRFVYCFSAMCGVKRGTWRRKLELFQSFGVSEGEVLEAFKTQPTIVLLADESIERKVRFLLDELKLGMTDIMLHPVILGYSLDKCILPRCAVLTVLMREGKIQRDIKLLQALLGGSKKFSTRYVWRTTCWSWTCSGRASGSAPPYSSGRRLATTWMERARTAAYLPSDELSRGTREKETRRARRCDARERERESPPYAIVGCFTSSQNNKSRRYSKIKHEFSNGECIKAINFSHLLKQVLAKQQGAAGDVRSRDISSGMAAGDRYDYYKRNKYNF
ncbi:uncharacterized protein LOC124647902 [Lolium rigidum]|uniref:uncharacterized protein LOC124647902 n=1 Tax=Lolium rigidum TaxID=89674 RepID=UPI001F5CBFEF|nr:uncharacterized protein LOC124647902 [Lolium rigidum]